MFLSHKCPIFTSQAREQAYLHFLTAAPSTFYSSGSSGGVLKGPGPNRAWESGRNPEWLSQRAQVPDSKS